MSPPVSASARERGFGRGAYGQLDASAMPGRDALASPANLWGSLNFFVAKSSISIHPPPRGRFKAGWEEKAVNLRQVSYYNYYTKLVPTDVFRGRLRDFR